MCSMPSRSSACAMSDAILAVALWCGDRQRCRWLDSSSLFRFVCVTLWLYYNAIFRVLRTGCLYLRILVFNNKSIKTIILNTTIFDANASTRFKCSSFVKLLFNKFRTFLSIKYFHETTQRSTNRFSANFPYSSNENAAALGDSIFAFDIRLER